MLGNKFYQTIFDEFIINYPHVLDEVVDWYPSGQFEITIKLRDGSRLTYGQLTKRVHDIKKYEENYLISEKTWREIFARRLYNKMVAKGITQKELAELSGVSQANISAYVKGEINPKAYSLVRLSKALECSISDLIDDIEL